MDSVEGKVVLITGGAGGIGLKIVQELLKNGAKGVAIVDIDEEAGHKAIDNFTTLFGTGRAIFVKTDITKKEEFEEAFDKTVKTYNQLDIVINDAGIVNEIEWEKTIAVNLTALIQGTYLAMQKYLPIYKSGSEGVIVNIASIAGLQPFSCVPVYSTTKHGVVGLGKALGCQEFYEKYKARVLTICPGKIDSSGTNMNSSKILFTEKFEELVEAFCPLSQPAERVAETLVEVVKNGRNGSVWVTEDNQPSYEVVMPDRRAMRV